MLKLIAATIGLAFLAGCSVSAKTLLNEGVEGVKEFEDTKATVAIQAPCAMSLGAYNRVLNTQQQRDVMSLCGGAVERPVTVEDLRRELTN